MINDVELDYCRAVLFEGHVRMDKNGALDEMIRSYGPEYMDRVQSLDWGVERVRSLARKARKLALKGTPWGSLDLENLLLSARDACGAAGREYVQVAFLEATGGLGGLTPSVQEDSSEITLDLSRLFPLDCFRSLDDEEQEGIPLATPSPSSQGRPTSLDNGGRKGIPKSPSRPASANITQPDLLTAGNPQAKPGAATPKAPAKTAPRPAWQPQDGFPVGWKRGQCGWRTSQRSCSNPFGERMYEYCKAGLWDGPDGDVRQKRLVREIQQLRYISKSELDKALAIAEAWLKRARKLLSRVRQELADSEPPELTKALRDEVVGMGGPLQEKANRMVNDEMQRRMRRPLIETYKVDIRPEKPMLNQGLQEIPLPEGVPSAPNAVTSDSGRKDVCNDISALGDAPHWCLYVDESGREFDTNGRGLVAGVLFDARNPLPEQPPLHASNDWTEDALVAGDKAIEALLQHRQCGVLALPAKAYTSATGWASMVASFIELVMAMLPLPKDDKETALTVYVEQKGDYASSANFGFLADACRYNLMQHFPQRADRIKLEMNVMDKTCPYNAYPDLVAHTCFTGSSRFGNPVARQRFVITGWEGVCFLDHSIEELRDALSAFQSGNLLSTRDWNHLLAKGAWHKPGLLGALLKSVGKEAQNDPKCWEQYLEATIEHLSSKSLNLRQLRDQLDWLKNYQPLSAHLPPRVQLLWLTSKLAEANHLGQISQETPVVREFQRLSQLLFQEDAPLVCFAHLHLAVAQTNAFQFEEAQRILMEYTALAGVKTDEEASVSVRVRQAMKALNPAIPGLRCYGQMLSSLGQHEAFQGNNQAAVEYFHQAISCFGQLTEDQAGDIDQTRAYLVTSQMDCAPDDQETKTELERYLGAPLVEAARRLAASDEDCDKYHHHILLRYLVLGRAPEAVQAYLEQASRWKVGYGHPWELIEFYRALLVVSAQKRLSHLHKALDIAREGGFTLLVIAAVILGALSLDEESALPELAKAVSGLERNQPELGALFAPLKEQPTRRLAPLALAQAVLPFNFR
ncbi:MAG: hypothetical protein IJJ33_08350 [Victivallales bacterium]|nr:hypothetical protein [Victivallales bacterium]